MLGCSQKQVIQGDPLFQDAHVISLNETHMAKHEAITTDMLGVTHNFVVFSHNWDANGGGIALTVHNKFLPSAVPVDCSSKILVVKLQQCFNVVVVCIYRPPAKHICSFSEDLLSILMSTHNIP